METIKVRILAKEAVAQDIVRLRMAAVDGSCLPDFEPGSHIDLHLGPRLIRQYSLCGAKEDNGYTVAVKLEPESRGGSIAVHQTVKVGDELQISKPRNNFPMAAEAAHSILFAGGIGITPIISMARALALEARPFELHYFCRTLEHAAFREELGVGPLASSSSLHLGSSRDEVKAIVHDKLKRRTASSHVYMCGPAAFMEAVQSVARECGWAEEAIHLEYFSAQPLEASEQGAFKVKLSRSGLMLKVEAGQTIVDALRLNGIEIETSCEQGVCGTCVTAVLEGTPEHMDSFLTGAEKARGDCMAVCVSRAKTPQLILDL